MGHVQRESLFRRICHSDLHTARNEWSGTPTSYPCPAAVAPREPGRFVVAAAPSHLARRGTPQTPQDLLHHDCLCIRTATDGARYAWELERGGKAWRVPVQGPVTTNDPDLMRLLAVAGVGLLYAVEPQIADELRRGSLRLVLDAYAAAVPGFFLYFPSRAQVSPALRAFVDVARELGRKPDRKAS